MTTSLIKAILSMDSYNRGYAAGITISNNGIGDFTISKDSLDLGFVGSTETRRDQDIGFYALAYTDGNGGTIISYRGTDSLAPDLSNPLFLPDDIHHGWSLGGGITASKQGRMAVEFYQAVAGDGNWQTADISLTGHSLGGGLAANDNWCANEKAA